MQCTYRLNVQSRLSTGLHKLHPMLLCKLKERVESNQRYCSLSSTHAQSKIHTHMNTQSTKVLLWIISHSPPFLSLYWRPLTPGGHTCSLGSSSQPLQMHSGERRVRVKGEMTSWSKKQKFKLANDIHELICPHPPLPFHCTMFIHKLGSQQ